MIILKLPQEGDQPKAAQLGEEEAMLCYNS